MPWWHDWTATGANSRLPGACSPTSVDLPTGGLPSCRGLDALTPHPQSTAAIQIDRNRLTQSFMSIPVQPPLFNEDPLEG